MGGHGGLNILPQKRWNVYNRDNRLKVSRDEAKARAEEEAEQERAVQAEREFRHQLLLSRATGAPDTAPAPQPTLQPAAQPEQLEHINFWKEDELKLKEQHPEVLAAKLDEARKRGNVDTYTSDPRFDERFKFGYQMKGEEPWWAKIGKRHEATMTSQPDPTFAQLAAMGQAAPKALSAQQPQQQPLPSLPGPAVEQPAGKGHRKRRHGSESESEEHPQVAAARAFLLQTLGPEQLQGLQTHSSSNDSDSESSGTDSTSSGSGSSGRDRSRRRRRRSSSEAKDSKSSRSSKKSKRQKRSRSRDGSKGKHKDKGKRRKSDRRERKGNGQGGAPGATGSLKSIEALRAERLAREEAERGRARLVLVGALDGERQEPTGYHSGFGFANSLKRQRR